MSLISPVNWAEAAQAIAQLVGFPFVIYPVNELRKSLYSTSHSNIYTHYTDTIRWFLEKPYLYPYFRENARLEGSVPASEMALRHAEVQSLCELTTTLFEHATLERHNMPSTTWRDCWLPYIKASYERSAEMWLFFEAHRDFYIPEYDRLIVGEIAPKIQPAWRLPPRTNPRGSET
jgi:hypothetical protein